MTTETILFCIILALALAYLLAAGLDKRTFRD